VCAVIVRASGESGEFSDALQLSFWERVRESMVNPLPTTAATDQVSFPPLLLAMQLWVWRGSCRPIL